MSEKQKELVDMDNDVLTAVGEGWWVEVEEGIRGINGNGKNTIKKQKKKEMRKRLNVL